MFYQDRPTALDDSKLSFVVKNAENNVYGNNAATLYTNRANMIPPLRIPKAVC